jgi:hypothetical protein
MTPTLEQRAEEIVNCLNGNCRCEHHGTDTDIIAVALRQTREEGRNEALSELHLETFWRCKAYADGRKQALTEAAKVADQATIWDGAVVREQILSLALESGLEESEAFKNRKKELDDFGSGSEEGK